MASDNRGHNNTENQSATQTSVMQTYAKVTSHSIQPNKDQAIIMDSIEGITNDDYLDGLENIMDISNVKFMSKISGGRVCAFLSSRSLVENLINKSVQIKDHLLTIRPLMEKNKRVVISNVSPIIPHKLLVDMLKSKGIRLASQMNYVRAGLNKPGRSHILSFRRQICIKEDDEHLLPDSLQITYDNSTYWIYMSTDSTCCFLCKQNGHVAKPCPKQFQERPTSIEPTRTVNEDIICNTLGVLSSTQDISNQKKGIKKPVSSSLSSEGLYEDQFPKINENAVQPSDERSSPTLPPLPTTKTDKFKKPIIKKIKMTGRDTLENSTKDLDEILSPIKDILDHCPDLFVLNYTQFKMFLIKSRGHPNSLEIAEEFTKDINGLIDMIDIVQPHIEDRSLKSRCTRIKKKLLLQSLAEFTVPKGGFFLWIKVQGIKDTWKMIMHRGFKEGVIMAPGAAFMKDTSKPCNAIRASFAKASYEEMDLALQRLADLIRYELRRNYIIMTDSS